jgi:plastocyanin
MPQKLRRYRFGMLFRRACALVAALVLLGACASEAPVNSRPQSGTGVASDVGGVQQVTVEAGLDLRFHPSTIIVHSGKVRIVLVNTAKPGAGPPHNLQLTGLPAADVPLAMAGQTQSVTFIAPAPGTYTFVCTIHAVQGQTGKLIVK